jgi:hypothetical protein
VHRVGVDLEQLGDDPALAVLVGRHPRVLDDEDPQQVAQDVVDQPGVAGDVQVVEVATGRRVRVGRPHRVHEPVDQPLAHHPQRLTRLERPVELAGEVAEALERAALLGEQPLEGVRELVTGVAVGVLGRVADELAAPAAAFDELGRDPLAGRGGLRQQRERDRAVEVEVLEVVHGVGDVVGPLHHLGLEALRVAPLGRDRRPDLRRLVALGGVEAPLGVRHLAALPRVLGGGVEGGAREVETLEQAAAREPFRHQPEGLGVALVPADVGRIEPPGAGGRVDRGRQRLLPDVPEGGVPEVVHDRRGLAQVRVGPEPPPNRRASWATSMVWVNRVR